MTDIHPSLPATEAELEAYRKAQSKRTLAIGLALFCFVALIFTVTMVRISQNAKANHHAAVLTEKVN